MKETLAWILMFFSPLLYAGPQYSNFKSLFSLNMGPQWDSPGEIRQFTVEQNTSKTYVAISNSQVLMGSEFFLGAEHSITSLLDMQIGLAVAMTSLTSVSGDIWEDADPNFNNYTYAYKVAPLRTTLSAKWLLRVMDYFTPYIGAGVGMSFNRSYNYQITPKIFEEVSSPLYTSNVSASFAYNVGLGLQKQLDSHVQIGFGYVFSDWGQSALGRAPGQTINAPLSLSHLYMNQCVASFTYLF
jgi:opacity protein-like surface antigen